ncbi:hypothetical protein Y032_0022g631 [Ancylostoma ceylanicum]|uniref:Uncharacterized protein n=1 Tax=Ancylostoma ceylanicum TaxID=53326 RepID=A0A016V087_9BILA|nr:hypothetical protein Y032_0022g631 [Ancylostoma ceylanicum]
MSYLLRQRLLSSKAMAATGMFAALLLLSLVRQAVAVSSFPGSKNREQVECSICDGLPNFDFTRTKVASVPSSDAVSEVKAPIPSSNSFETKSAPPRNGAKLQCNICDMPPATELAKQSAAISLPSSSYSAGRKINEAVSPLNIKSTRAQVECNICDYVPSSEFDNRARTTSLSSESASEEKITPATTSSGHQCVVAEPEQKEQVLPDGTAQELPDDSSKSEDKSNSTGTCHFLDHIVLPWHADLLKTAFVGGLTIRAESLSVNA